MGLKKVMPHWLNERRMDRSYRNGKKPAMRLFGYDKMQLWDKAKLKLNI